MFIIFAILVLGFYAENFSMEVARLVVPPTPALTKPESPKKLSIEIFYNIIGYKKERYVSLRTVGNCIKNMPNGSYRQWLESSDGCQCLMDLLAREQYKRWLPVVAFVKLDFLLYVPFIHSWVKNYLEKNPHEHRLIQEKYFHRLLFHTSLEELMYYKELGLSFSSKDGRGLTWFISAVSAKLTDIVRHFIENAAIYGIDIHAQDIDGMNALMYALEDPNVELVKILLNAGLVLPEAYKHREITLRECLRQVNVPSEPKTLEVIHHA